ncbi:urease accessory protein UreF-like [Apiospora aurea]|uniref:Urease accessory protein UreF-like n=1 Tax=Apiospora aurea TaxID=335848 RepID=A0ABR1QVQ2_9PEZI
MTSQNRDEGNGEDTAQLEAEIADLEARLKSAKERLSRPSPTSSPPPSAANNSDNILTRSPSPPTSSHHFLLLLSDSALPLGSFAFSSGLESYLAHQRSSARKAGHQPRPSFTADFLPLSLSSYASTTLPFVLAAHRDPTAVADLDDQLDAAVICTVGRRASIAQGRALLGIWERSFVPSSSASSAGAATATGAAEECPSPLRRLFYIYIFLFSSNKHPNRSATPAPVSAHLGPLFGAVCALLGLTLPQTAYVFLLSHAKALVSAAVRASLFGPYQAQRVLASPETQALVAAFVAREWDTPPEDAGQRVPVMDLWIGRHEMLYSRIFNS